MKQHHEPDRNIPESELREFFEKGWSFKTKAEVESYFNDKTNDIMQNADNASKILAMRISSEYRRNLDNPLQLYPTGEIAGRYHFLLLYHLAETVKNPKDSAIEQTFRMYEKKWKEVEDGWLPDEELLYLQSLPSIATWSENKPSLEKMYESGYFGEMPVGGVVEADLEPNEGKRLITKIVNSYPEDLQDKVRSLYTQMLEFYQHRHGEEEGTIVFLNCDTVKRGVESL